MLRTTLAELADHSRCPVVSGQASSGVSRSGPASEGWRGILQDRLVPLFGVGGAIVLQAASFGLQHAWGFPRGPVGVVLAGGWAVMLGLLRRHSGGLLSPILAHVVADATIAVLVLGCLR
ncbi:MAG: CPBP family intramembrane metalloprotease [Myxococcales bacterium]|nr:CPBP family intramembrane metalloprotease [Myxococcales bacterium]